MIDKPSSHEDEYFAKLDYERKQKLEVEKQKELAGEEKKRLKETHYMCCPKCGMNLIEIDYENIKIDKCSSCGGIWLDAGEMEEVAKDGKGIISSFYKMF